tara:strand:+ start:7602 stop:8099 length:498 start_codon:yes stop_codon:yes gene_type:complete
MNDSEYICPVPKDQRPLNEYKKLKESNNFFWCIQDKDNYLKAFLSLSFFSLLFSSFILVISAFSFSSIKYFIIYSVLASVIITTLSCCRSYLGWQYIYSRLMEATVPYEESGWYDGQIWIKPPEILLQDRLVGTYEIYPGLLRLQYTLASLLFLFLIAIVLLKNT